MNNKKPTEKELAENLRSLCTPYGDESRSQLPKTAKIILNMGELYLERAENGTGMEQKLDFIKCSALLNGAKVRYDTFLNDRKKVEKVDALLKKLGACLYRQSGSVGTQKNLNKVSSDLKNQLTSMREQINHLTDQIPLINYDLPDCEVTDIEDAKIQGVLYITKTSTELYKHLMQEITTTCLEIMGGAPCHYALVGLGSLAREEITLYSDFEHVIVLDDEVASCENYEEIREYFRWFTVLFQVIISGLGETFIRSVGVRSLNDLYSQDKSKNWYFDVITPCGVSFDGRVPHSCNNPLGRQELTKDKRHIVELIQPTSKMAALLTLDEHIKNGYYLKDILARTCFVFGNKKVYDDFKKKSQKFLDKEEVVDTIIDQAKNLQKNVNDNIRGSAVLHTELEYKDMKSLAYRPITALLAYFARICRISASSSFEIICQLQRRKILPFTEAQSFKQALATACELRLKAYAAIGHQRQKILENKITDFVEKKSLIRCIDAITLLSGIIQNVAENFSDRDGFRKRLKEHKYDPNLEVLIKAAQLIYLGFFGDAQILLENLVETEVCEKSYGNRNLGVLNICNLLALCYITKAKIDEESENLLSAAEKLLQKTVRSVASNYIDKANACELLCRMYRDQQRNWEGLAIFDRWFDIIHKAEYILKPENLIQMRRLQVEMMLRCIKPEEVATQFVNVLSEENDFCTEVILTKGLAEAYALQGNMTQAKDLFCKAVTLSRNHAPWFDKNQLMAILDGILDKQLKHDWWYDASMTLEMRKSLQESQLKQVYDAKRKYENKQVKYHIKKSEKSDNFTSQTHLKAALEICTKQDSGKNFIDEHALALCRMLGRNVENFPTFVEAYEAASLGVQKHPKLYLGLLHSLYQVLNHYGHEIYNGNLSQIYHTILRIFETFKENLKHPRFIHILHILNYMISSKEEISYVLPKGFRRDLFAMKHILPGGDTSAEMYNYAVGCFANWEVNNCTDRLWNSIQSSGKRMYVRKRSIELLFQLIYATPHMKTLLCVSDLFKNFVSCHSIKAENAIARKYNTAVEQYVVYETKTAARTFWSIIITGKSGSYLQNKSIVMLFFVIMTEMEKSHYGQKVNDRYLTLVRPNERIEARVNFNI